jgi:hypothetical protein
MDERQSSSAVLAVDEPPAAPVGQIIGRGFAAAHGACAGAGYLFLLHAPAQVVGAVAQVVQAQALRGPEQLPDPMLVLLSVSLSLGSFVFAVAVFLLFPLVQGGILGQVRDRLESPNQSPGPFWAYGRAYYCRLLGSFALYTLLMFVVLAPVMCLGASLALQQWAPALVDEPVAGAAPAPPLDTQQFARQCLSNPVVVAAMVGFALLVSAMGMVYWVANCFLVTVPEGVLACWRRSLHFCRENCAALTVVWLLFVAVSVLAAPIGLAGQLGFVSDLWAVTALALVQTALIAYTGVLIAGLTMSLYLARRPPAPQPEAAWSANVGPTATDCRGDRAVVEGR